MPHLHSFLTLMLQRGASDLHITAGERAKLRVDGRIIDAGLEGILTGEDTRRLSGSILTEVQRARLENDDELDFSFELEDLARFRANVYRQRGCVTLAIRQIPLQIRPLEELGLPAIVASLAERPRGLVLVTGPTGAGKSTTLAAMLDKINKERRGHILTIEDPIEFIHPHLGCIVSQREVGADTRSFSHALKHALRQDPDVILVGEMRDLETVQAALTIAETGHTCLTTLHTNSAIESVNRIIHVFPSHQQSQIRAQLALVLEGVVTQTLLPRADRSGRTVAAEVMICTPAVRACIRDDKLHQIQSIMQAGKKHGMQTLNDSLCQLYMRGEVTLEECMRTSSEPAALLKMVGLSGPA